MLNTMLKLRLKLCLSNRFIIYIYKYITMYYLIQKNIKKVFDVNNTYINFNQQ